MQLVFLKGLKKRTIAKGAHRRHSHWVLMKAKAEWQPMVNYCKSSIKPHTFRFSLSSNSSRGPFVDRSVWNPCAKGVV